MLGPTGPPRGLDLGVRPDGLDSPKVGPFFSGSSSSEGPSSLEGLRPMESIKLGRLSGKEDCHDPSGVALPLVWAGPSQLKESDAEGFPSWVYDGRRRQAEMEPCLVEKSRTNCALIEEATRYGCVTIPCGLMASRDDRVTCLRETPLHMLLPLGPPEEENACRWDLREGPSACKESSGKELRLAHSMPRDGNGWEEESWEESELAKFSKFLGFSTEGLEKEILEFLIKIQKRREKVHSKNLLEKSKFERELKRLECSINYEGGKTQKSGMIVGGCQIMVVK